MEQKLRDRKVSSSSSATAMIDSTARIGKRCKVWAFAQIGEHAEVGDDCMIGNGAYIDRNVKVGNRVRIHNKALLYHGVNIEDDVFIGPGVCFTNDKFPRNQKTRALRDKRWVVKKGASIGANATILPDVNIGEYALIGAGSVVTRSVLKHTVVCGNPARSVGIICFCGQILKRRSISRIHKIQCNSCHQTIVF